jgi:hypothetical protein
MKRWILTLAAATMLGGALSGCETPTPYQPLATGAAQAGGYSEIKLEDNRWRVAFQGNSLTARGTVETYLLYRAAELTVNQGYDWFEIAQRHTDKHTETYADPIGPYGFGWRYRRRGFGWGDPFWGADVDVQTIEQYEASAEIVVHHGQKPADDPGAFDARQVMSNLGGKIARPT